MFFLGTKNALDFTLAKNTSLQSRPPCWPRQGRGLSQQLVSTHCDGRIVLYPMKVPSRAAEVRPDIIETVRRTVGMGDGFSTSFNQTLLETGKEVMK